MDIEIAPGLFLPEEDVVLEFIRSPGPGGQNVNKVASAIRVTHLPTGLQVVASTYRDQLQNKAQRWRRHCCKRLRGRDPRAGFRLACQGPCAHGASADNPR